MFRFTIRDMLWLTVVVAVCCSWWLHVRSVEDRHARQLSEFTQQILSTVNETKAEFERIQARYKSDSPPSADPRP